MNNVLVVGGTGNVGSQVVEQLLDRGESVYVLIRSDEAKVKAIGLGAKSIYGDLLKPGTLLGVTDKIDYVVATAASMTDEFTEGYKALILSAFMDEVEQFVFVSNHSEDGDQSISMLAAKTAIHNLLRDSGLNFTIAMFEPFMGTMKWIIEAYLQFGSFPIYVDEGVDKNAIGLHYWIEEAEVARVTAALVGNTAAHNQTIRIGGKEAYTMYEFIRRYGLERGKPVNTVYTAQAFPGDMFYSVMIDLNRYNSPMPDEMSEFGI